MRFFRRGGTEPSQEPQPDPEAPEAPPDEPDAPVEEAADDLIGDEWQTATPVEDEDVPGDEELSEAERVLAPSADALLGQLAVPEPVTTPEPQPEPPPDAISWAWGADYSPEKADEARREREREQLEHGLEKSRTGFGARLRGAFGRGSDADWDEVEETLITGDVGAALAMDLVERARKRRDLDAADAVQAELAALLAPRDATRKDPRHGRQQREASHGTPPGLPPFYRGRRRVASPPAPLTRPASGVYAGAWIHCRRPLTDDDPGGVGCSCAKFSWSRANTASASWRTVRSAFSSGKTTTARCS